MAEGGDLLVKLGPPGGRKEAPIFGRRWVIGGQGVEGFLDIVEGEAHQLRCANEGDAAQAVAGVAPTVGFGALGRGEQAERFVEAESRGGHPGARGQLADRD